ncbi:hypothetical protein [Nakamurella deserti]|uniref:hypothetical protein n=1 Tax=Nakamurella deserti TaxID=2164074 RepID=UPI000DBE18F3|nr:hypothetical protein [Nakamurella deserti]
MSQSPYDGPNGQYPQHEPTYPAAPAGPAPYAGADRSPTGPWVPHGQPAPYGGPGGPAQQGHAPGGFGTDPHRRPGMVTAAAVLAFVGGGIYILGGLAALVGGSLVAVGGLFTVIAVVLLVIGGILIWGGVAALSGRDARILTIAVGAGIVLNLISLIGDFEARSLTGFVIPGLVLYFLLNAQSRAWFDRVGAKHL